MFLFIFLITYLSVMCVVADTVSDELHQPQNLSVSGIPNHFSMTARWSKMAGLHTECKVKYNVKLYSRKCPPEEESYIREWSTEKLNYTWNISEAIYTKCVALCTVFQDCGNNTCSKQVYKDIPQPQDLVKNVSCVYYDAEKMNCTWNLVSNTSDLQFFYIDKKDSLKQCSVYIGNGHMRTGCHLYGERFLSNEWLYILFNGKHEGHPIQNMFLRDPRESVTTQPPKLNITREGHKLVFQSSHPHFSKECWLHRFHVRKCNKDDEEYSGYKDANWSVHISYDEACKYTVRVQAKFNELCGYGESKWSEPEEYGANNDPNWSLKATLIAIPVIMSSCLIIALVVFRRHKDRILPRVPEPSLLVKDMFNDKNEGKTTKDLRVLQLYVPSEELVEKKLQLEPEATLLHLKA